MEKIKLAIEESKKSRSQTKQKKIAKESSAVFHDRSEHGEIQVEYKNTRIVSLDPTLLEKNRIVSFKKNDQLSIGFDILRTQVIKKMMENGWRTLAITSPTPGCGKTVLSINLAMSIAYLKNKTSLLVDFDLRRPTVRKYLGLPPGPSINDVLSGESTVADSLVNPGLDRFVVLPTETPIKDSSEVLSSQKVARLINELRNRYDERIVIFDLPPILGSDDVLTMMPQVDCVLLVVGNGLVSETELKECMRYIDSDKLLGTVLNMVDIPHTEHAYYNY